MMPTCRCFMRCATTSGYTAHASVAGSRNAVLARCTWTGKAVRSCVTPLSSLTAQQKVVTLEGLGTPQRLHPVQRAFIEEQAVQCGYCINGMIMESAALLAKTKKPTEAQVKEALANNLCRCGTHARIVKAVMRAATA